MVEAVGVAAADTAEGAVGVGVDGTAAEVDTVAIGNITA
jgi:hypothetical protein